MRPTTLIAALSLGLGSHALAAAPAATPDIPKLPDDARAAIDHAKALSKAFRAVAKFAAPSVVSIKTSVAHGAISVGGPFPQTRMLPMGQRVEQGEGTGFVITDQGHIATNNHVVRGASRIMVHLHDGREAPATLVGADPETDVAVLKIDLADVKPIDFGNSDEAEVGDWVIALGSPFGLKDSVTAGIISAKGREVGLSPLENYMQTDAQINPGNSGGPLVDMDGRVVGMNTAIESRSGGSDGIGFAIPAGMVKSVVESIIGGGSPGRGFLGIQMQPVLPEGLQEQAARGRVVVMDPQAPSQGVVVRMVVDGAAADKAGIRPGDLIMKINGEAITSLHRAQRAIRLCKPGSTCQIEYLRDGQQMTADARLDDASTAVTQATPVAPIRRPTR